MFLGDGDLLDLPEPSRLPEHRQDDIEIEVPYSHSRPSRPVNSRNCAFPISLQKSSEVRRCEGSVGVLVPDKRRDGAGSLCQRPGTLPENSARQGPVIGREFLFRENRQDREQGSDILCRKVPAAGERVQPPDVIDQERRASGCKGLFQRADRAPEIFEQAALLVGAGGSPGFSVLFPPQVKGFSGQVFPDGF